MIRHGQPPYLECSSKGDKRFSAYCAKVSYNGITASIESIYQSAKIFEDGSYNLSPSEAKLRQKLGQKITNRKEVIKLYSVLWNLYINQHPELLKVLIYSQGLSDIFGQEGHCCQATELWRIRNNEINLTPEEKLLRQIFGE